MEELLEVSARLAIDPRIIVQQIVGQPCLFRKALRRQIVGIALRRNCLDRDEPFFYEVLDVGVDEPEGDAETAAEVPLGEGIVIGKLVQDLERTVRLGSERGWF